jgi:transcriptional regulator with XRE-family HTH domain
MATQNLSAAWNTRRKQLGMKIDTLAKRSSVSSATVKRILSGDKNVSFGAIESVAHELGLPLGVQAGALSADEMRTQQAERKARRIVSVVQGTSALESQGLDQREFESLVRKTAGELLHGPSGRLWDDL